MTTNTSITYSTDAEQLVALRAPFPITDVKTRTQGNIELKYYEAYVIQQRLLDVLGTGLSIRTGQVIATDSNVNIETILDIEWASGRNTSTSGWGSADILLGKSDRIVNDPYKTAATDSIKVAASKLGVAAELYDSKYREGLEAQLKILEEKEAERLFYTCQVCRNEIKSGTINKLDGTVIELTAKQVAIGSRQKLGKRMCIACADQAAAEKSSAGKTKPDAVEIDR